MDTSTDQLLLTEFMEQNSEEAFRALVDRHGPWIFAAANRQLRDRQLAEDATQVVFILLFQRSPNMRSHHQLTAWLFNTVNYTVKNILRSRRRRDFHELKAMHRQAPPPAESPHANDLADQLDAAVASLAPRHRTPILLRFYLDYSFDQIAQSLHVSEAAARKRTSRAVELLRKRFGIDSAAISTGSLSMAAAAGMHSAPDAFLKSISQTAIAAKTGATLPPAITLATKATLFMTTAQMKLSVIVVAIVVAIAVPTTLLTIRYTRSSAASVSETASAQTPPIASAAPDPFDFYRLDNKQAMKYFPAPPASVRQAVYDKIDPQHQTRTAPPAAYFIEWPAEPTFPPNVLWSNRNSYNLTAVAHLVLHIHPQDIEGNRDDFLIPGDFSMDAAAPDGERALALQAICQNNLQKHVNLTVRNVDRSVIVISGQWNYAPPSSPRIKPGNAPLIEVYDDGIHAKSSLLRIMASMDLGDELGRWVGKTIVIEAKDVPQDTTLSFNEPVSGSKNRARILDHFCEQTGLKWSEQNRSVRRLIVEQTP